MRSLTHCAYIESNALTYYYTYICSITDICTHVSPSTLSSFYYTMETVKTVSIFLRRLPMMCAWALSGSQSDARVWWMPRGVKRRTARQLRRLNWRTECYMSCGHNICLTQRECAACRAANGAEVMIARRSGCLESMLRVFL